MHNLRRLLRGFSSQLFKFVIFFLAISAALVMVFGSPEPLKNSLRQSGVYSGVVDTVINQSKKNQGEQQNEVPLDDPKIRQAIKTAFPPEFIEQIASDIIDGMYDWLQGKTASPEFTINLEGPKQQLAVSISEEAFNRLNGLPVCTAEQLRTMDLNNIEPFSVPCRPPGLDLKAEQKKVADKIANSSEVLKDTDFTGDDLQKKDERTAFDQASSAPTIFKWIGRLPWILGGLAALMAVSLILLHQKRWRGVWVIGRTLFFVGIFLLVVSLLALYVTSQINLKGSGTDTLNLEPTLLLAARSLLRAATRISSVFGGIYILIGGIIMLCVRFMHPEVLKRQHVVDNSPVPNYKDNAIPGAKTDNNPDITED